jgi:hypothetical protein
MMTLLSSLLGFLSAAFPELLKIWRDHADAAHEIEILKLQMEYQKQGGQERLQEINASADIAESAALYKTYTTGIRWVDALNGTVRPVTAYAFFLLYAGVKIVQMRALPWQIWTQEDQAVFAGIISFYFGQRSMHKALRRS